MGGGVSPFEWILPPVAVTHAAVNAAAQISGNPRAKIVAPGSQIDKEREFDERMRGEDQAAREAEAARLAGQPRPQTPEEEEASRRRLRAARSSNLGGRRASQYLTESNGSLGVAL